MGLRCWRLERRCHAYLLSVSAVALTAANHVAVVLKSDFKYATIAIPISRERLRRGRNPTLAKALYGFYASASCQIGKEIWNAVPLFPAPVRLRILMVPPCRAMIALVKARPSPVPSSFFVVKYGWKTLSFKDSAIPQPLSATSRLAFPNRFVRRTVTVPSGDRASSAFTRRLETT